MCLFWGASFNDYKTLSDTYFFFNKPRTTIPTSFYMILINSVNELAMNLGETYLVTENGNERLGKQKLDLVVL